MYGSLKGAIYKYSFKTAVLQLVTEYRAEGVTCGAVRANAQKDDFFFAVIGAF